LADTADGALIAEYFERCKMIRARLVFASTAAVGGDPARATFAAEAVELVHGASLFHDDLIDGADQRRGLPALHCRVPPSEAILLGDFLLMRAFDILCRSREAVYSSGQVIDAVQVLSAQSQLCCRGQRLEIEFSGRLVSDTDYFAIVEDKTSALFIAATALGGIMGNGSEEDCAALTVYSRHLGVAFQICDDMLDLLGNEGTLGKPVGNSFAHWRPLLPVVYLSSYGSLPARKEWVERCASGCSYRELLPILHREGIIERIADTQASYVTTAVASLEGMPDGDGLRALIELPASILTAWR